jgi:hypothetical protein
MVSPFGGDGGDTLVDPNNGNRAVNEYVFLDMWRTENGGRSDGSSSAFTEISPSCFAFTYTPDPCDPSPRFIAPFRADVHDLNHWIAGGEYVWESTLGWDTTCGASACDWQIIHDTGAGHSITAIAVNGSTTYAGWCGNCNIKATTPFLSHIDTNYGGTWHTLTPPNLPNRFIASLTVDPTDPAHVYATYNGFSRRWVPSGGIGHVFESVNGGGSWTDITGNLPDAPSDDLIIINGSLVLATDIGVFIADAGDPTHWSVFGTGLPAASTNDLTVSPDGSYIVAATHGRGLWKLASP